MRRRRTQKKFCESIVRVLESRPGEDGNATEYLVAFHDTFEPIQNLNPSCYAWINELEPGLLERSKNDLLDQVGTDNNNESDSENEIEQSISWEVKGISNYSKTKNGKNIFLVSWNNKWMPASMIKPTLIKAFELRESVKVKKFEEEKRKIEAKKMEKAKEMEEEKKIMESIVKKMKDIPPEPSSTEPISTQSQIQSTDSLSMVETPMLPEPDNQSERPSLEEINQETSPKFLQRYSIKSNNLIDHGKNSIFVLCKVNDTNEEVAVKVLRLRDNNDVEIDALFACTGHPNIVEVLDVVKDDYFVFIVMKFLADESLLLYVERERPLDERLARKIFIQIAQALSYIHSKQFIHRDLRMKKIKLSGEGNVKILGFSLAAGIISNPQKKPRKLHVRLDNSPPETITKKIYKKEADVWCLGVILFEMLMGYHPYCSDSNIRLNEVRNRIVNCNIQFDLSRMPPLSPSAMHLIKCLLEPDRVNRIQSDRIIQQSWCSPGENTIFNHLLNEDGTIQHLEEISSDQRKKLIQKLQAIEMKNKSSTKLTLSTSLSVNSPKANTMSKQNSPSELILHQPEKTTSPPGPCDANNSTTSTAAIPKGNYACNICEKRFAKKKYLQNHKHTHLGLKYICEEENCSRMFSLRGKLSEHVKRNHKRKIKESEKVGKIVPGDNMDEKKKISCKICGEKVSTKSILKRHTRYQHQDKPKIYECHICQRPYTRLERVKRHLRLSH